MNTWEDILKQLLNWPFLLFLFSFFFLIRYHKIIDSILSRLTNLKWGDKEIIISEIREEFKKDLDPVRTELYEFEKRGSNLQQDTSQTSSREDPEVTITAALSGVYSDQWRSIERLAYILGTTEYDTLKIIKNYKNIEISEDSSGRTIARIPSG
jgi:hypothetical protein